MRVRVAFKRGTRGPLVRAKAGGVPAPCHAGCGSNTALATKTRVRLVVAKLDQSVRMPCVQPCTPDVMTPASGPAAGGAQGPPVALLAHNVMLPGCVGSSWQPAHPSTPASTRVYSCVFMCTHVYLLP